MEMQIGNTKIIIDTSYLETRTDEQKRADQLMLTDAIWSLYDLEDAG